MDEKVIEFFAPAAKLVLERGDKHDAMCRALAALSGLIEVPKPRRWAAPWVSFSCSVFRHWLMPRPARKACPKTCVP